MPKEIICPKFYIQTLVLKEGEVKAQVKDAIKANISLRCRNRIGTILTPEYVKDTCLSSKCLSCPFFKI